MLIVFFHFINRADIRVIESGCSTCFTLKPLQSRGIPDQTLRQEFEGHMTLELQVFGLIDHTHATTTEFPDDTVMCDCLADHWRQSFLVVHREKRLHFLAQSWVIRACLGEESGTLLRFQLQRALEYNLDPLPTFRCHAHAGDPHNSCFLSQSRAVIHSRFTVEADTPNTKAVSSSDNPPKKRNATIWPCLESRRESPCKASSSATTLTCRSGIGAMASSRTSLIPASRFAAW